MEKSLEQILTEMQTDKSFGGFITQMNIIERWFDYLKEVFVDLITNKDLELNERWALYIKYSKTFLENYKYTLQFNCLGNKSLNVLFGDERYSVVDFIDIIDVIKEINTYQSKPYFDVEFNVDELMEEMLNSGYRGYINDW